MKYLIALFSEAEKGRFNHPYLCNSLEQLSDTFGNPPAGSKGLYFAIQALLYQRDILFFRVEEEGFSASDYLAGIHYIRQFGPRLLPTAICLPGVGDPNILKETDRLCKKLSSFLIITPHDLFDYLTYS